VPHLGELGYSCEELDLRDYFSAPERPPERLADLDLIDDAHWRFDHPETGEPPTWPGAGCRTDAYGTGKS
jgi:hypothetical protein